MTLHVTLGVLTYKRPDGISKLLDVLMRQHRSAERPYALTVVVVDNDAAGSSKDVVLGHAENGAYRLIYVVEEQQGIPIARNRAMDSAPTETDLFCFMDDDEWPVDNWVDAMLATRQATGADCIYGPVEPVFEGPVSDWLRDSRLYARKRYMEGQRLDFAASNNVMFDLRRFQALNLRFDERMRFTGGSDYLFFNQAVRRGITIHWCSDALVYDVFPVSRLTLKWQRQRQYRLGNTFAVAVRLEGSRAEQVKLLARGVMRLALGVAMSPAMAVSPYWGGRAMVHMLRGAGTTVGMLGHAYNEYDPARMAKKKSG